MFDALLLGLIGAFFLKLAYERADVISQFIIRQSCRLLPKDVRTEKQEQYEADSYYTEGEASQIVHSLGAMCAVMRETFKSRIIIDRIFAAGLFVAVAPLMLIISLFVAIEQRGYPIKKFRRFGENSMVVHVYQFKTMIFLEKDQVFRISILGKVIRRFRFDEIPVLFNVLRGDIYLPTPPWKPGQSPWKPRQSAENRKKVDDD